jgi:outer membrane lipoprotein-sorting protein
MIRGAGVKMFVSASITRVSAVAMAIAVLGAPGVQARRVDAVAWTDVVAAYGHVKDYTALYDKQERAIDDFDLQRINLWFRKPLDVKLEWLNNKGKPDQWAVYRQGMNDGKLLAKKSGMLGGMLGIMSLDPTSGRALSDSKHPITEVGIGHLIDEASRAMDRADVDKKPAVTETLEGAEATRFEFGTAAGGKWFGVDGARRVTVWVDNTLKLPVKVEIVDAKGALLERHRFTNVKLNVGLADAVFTL